MYKLGGWHLNKWVKTWFTLELHCQASFRKLVYCMYKMLQHLFSIVFWKLLYVQLGGWHIISIKKYIRSYEVGIWRDLMIFWYQDLLLTLQLIPIPLIQFGLFKLLKTVVLEMLCDDYSQKIAAGVNFLKGHFLEREKEF